MKFMKKFTKIEVKNDTFDDEAIEKNINGVDYQEISESQPLEKPNIHTKPIPKPINSVIK